MKNNVFLIFMILLLISCKNQKQEEYQNIKIEKITPGSVVHTSLNESQLEKIKEIHKVLEEVNPISIEETIKNFKRDQYPDKEIEVWLTIAESYKKFSSKNLNDTLLNKRKEIFQLLLTRSLMSENEVLHSFTPKILNELEVKEILNSYQLDKKPIKIETH